MTSYDFNVNEKGYLRMKQDTPKLAELRVDFYNPFPLGNSNNNNNNVEPASPPSLNETVATVIETNEIQEEEKYNEFIANHKAFTNIDMDRVNECAKQVKASMCEHVAFGSLIAEHPFNNSIAEPQHEAAATTVIVDNNNNLTSLNK